MFCKNCGQPIELDARFCSKCGAELAFSSAPESEPDDDFGGSLLEFSLKPKFIPIATLIMVLPLQLFFTVWGAGFFGGFSMLPIQAFHLKVPPWSPFVFFGCLFFFGIPIVTCWYKTRSYAATEYRFYSNRLESTEGFGAKELKTILYRNIQEVTLTKGVFQKMSGLGTIILSTAPLPILIKNGALNSLTGVGQFLAAAQKAGVTRSSALGGFFVSDIENPEETYQKIRDLVNRHQPELR